MTGVMVVCTIHCLYNLYLLQNYLKSKSISSLLHLCNILRSCGFTPIYSWRGNPKVHEATTDSFLRKQMSNLSLLIDYFSVTRDVTWSEIRLKASALILWHFLFSLCKIALSDGASLMSSAIKTMIRGIFYYQRKRLSCLICSK